MMMTKRIGCGMLASVMLACFQVLAREPAPGTPTSADWEREASESALELYNAANKLNAKVVAAVDASLAALPGARLPGALAASAKGKGFVLFQRSCWESVGRRTAPTAEEASKTAVSLTAAADEARGVQLGVWAMRDLAKVSCSVSDLSSGSARIPASQVRVYHILNLIVPTLEKNAATADGDISQLDEKQVAGMFREHPVALLDLASVDVPAQQARAIWLDFLVPKSAAAGVYKGEAKILVDGREAAKVPIELTVLPFVLDPADEWGRGSFTSKHMDRQQLIQARENGHNMVSWWTSEGTSVKFKDGKAICDFTGFQDYLKLCDEVGYAGPHMTFIGGSDPKIQNKILKFLNRPEIADARKSGAARSFKDCDLSEPFGTLLCDVMKQYHAQMKAVGHGNMPACLLDEPDHEPRPQRINWYNKMFALVEKGAPEVPLYGTFYHEGDENKLSHHHAVWTSNCPSPEKYAACRQAGKQLWTYHFGFQYGSPLQPVRFRLGILPWVYEASGTFYWANFWNGVSPFDAFQAAGGDALDTASLPTLKGPLSSKMNKAIRESVDDRRYLVTLEKLIAQAKAAGGALATQAAADEAFLQTIRKPLFDKMAVRGGRPQFDALGRVEVAGTKGRKGVLAGGGKAASGRAKELDPLESGATLAFAEFVRSEVTDRILAYRGKVK
jgi:hypothetical protein